MYREKMLVKGFGTMILSINGGEGLEPRILEKNIVYVIMLEGLEPKIMGKGWNQRLWGEGLEPGILEKKYCVYIWEKK